MSDIDNAATGKDTAIQILVDGALKAVQDKVTRFSARARYDVVRVKGIGRTGESIDRTLVGWGGELEIAAGRAEVDELMDVIHAAGLNRVPVSVQVADTTRYRDGSSKGYLYPGVTLELETRTQRGEARTHTLRWENGQDRVALT